MKTLNFIKNIIYYNCIKTLNLIKNIIYYNFIEYYKTSKFIKTLFTIILLNIIKL